MCMQARLFDQLYKNDIDLILYPMPFCKGMSMGQNGSYAVFIDTNQIETNAELNHVLAHEIGHCTTGALHKLSSPYELIQQHENRANRWAYENCLPFDKLKAAMENGISECWQLAEHFNFPESFIKEAIRYYIQVKGYSFD